MASKRRKTRKGHSAKRRTRACDQKDVRITKSDTYRDNVTPIAPGVITVGTKRGTKASAKKIVSRRPRSPSDKRSAFLTFRTTEQNKAMVIAHAEEKGVDVSTYCESLVLAPNYLELYVRQANLIEIEKLLSAWRDWPPKDRGAAARREQSIATLEKQRDDLRSAKITFCLAGQRWQWENPRAIQIWRYRDGSEFRLSLDHLAPWYEFKSIA